MRTPIAALRAEAEIALRSPDPKDSLRRIVAGTSRVTHLAHQLLTFSRLESKQMPLLTRIDLAAMTGDAAERWVPLARQRNIDLDFELDPAKVEGEPFWLEELANNLLENALHYTPADGVVTVRCGHDADTVFWEVEGNGPGIPESERERVFERFYRLNSGDVDGCGLGLAIVREIVHVHHAAITIATGTSLGSALLRVCFPLPPPAEPG